MEKQTQIQEEQKTKTPIGVKIKNAYQGVKDWYKNTNEWNGFFGKPRNWIIGGLVVIAVTAGAAKLNNVNIENSVYQGKIISFGREGLIWDTYEGSFALGGENRSSTGYFSLDEQARNGENIEELAKQLYKATETRATVRIHGTKPAVCWPWRSSANYHVDKVEFLEE